MSALPPKADIGRGLFCPLCANSGHLSALFDHLVGLSEERGRNFDPERFGRLQVDDELEFGGNWTEISDGFSPYERRRST
ncbi:MAG: hypothetical protein WBM06_02480 [Pseudolabrys sp.]